MHFWQIGIKHTLLSENTSEDECFQQNKKRSNVALLMTTQMIKKIRKGAKILGAEPPIPQK